MLYLWRRVPMPQISLYIDEETLRKVEDAAKRQHLSISKWVSEQIRSKIDPVYPAGYEDLYGSVGEADIRRPVEVGFEEDSKREAL
jgi:hypothetical protein